MTKVILLKYVEAWALPGFAIAALLTVLIFLLSLLVIYVGDEYVSPAWSEQSVPAPRTY